MKKKQVKYIYISQDRNIIIIENEGKLHCKNVKNINILPTTNKKVF